MNKNYKKRLRMSKNKLSPEDQVDNCCDDPSITSKDGEIVCTNCGMVRGKNLMEKEARAFTQKEREQRKRTEIRWREFGPRTVLPNTRKDSKGKNIMPKGKTLFSRLSKIQRSLVSSIERNFWEAKPKLNLLTSKLNIPEHIKETAWKIYSVVAKKKLTMGRSIDGFIAASLYASIRVHEFPRLLEEVCDACMTPRHTVHRSLGIIIKEVLPEIGLKYKPITAEQLVFRFGNDLGLPMEIQRKAINMLIRASKNGLLRSGKDPKGLAASVIYMAARPSEHRMTQAEVSNIAMITEVTLRTRAKQIKSKLH
jgi:transcription initiation factor TFIIB